MRSAWAQPTLREAALVLLLATQLALPFAAHAQQSPASTPEVQTAQPAPAAAVPAPASQQTAPAPQAAAPLTVPGPSSPSAGSLLQTTFALIFVLALLAGLAWFMKRYGPKMAGGTAHLRVVGSLNLGGRERIMVVEVGDQWIVVGASPGRVNALATMPKRDAAETAAVLSAHVPPAGGFADWLKQTIDKRNAK